ncbi:MAG: hypothetical protein PF590_04870 [Candidatus Delongbacteria bacterium]|jgi:hypothetical protein|nr:hypothetical protein [Candidatus Delongbacteria bacterium]
MNTNFGKYIFLLAMISLISFPGLSQGVFNAEEPVLEFTHVKNLGPEKTVYFHIDGINDEDHKNAILERLLMDPSISDGRIFKTPNMEDRCQLYVNQDVDAAYVRNILKKLDVDYAFKIVSKNGHLEKQDQQLKEHPEQSPRTPIAIEGFPEYKHTGNPEADKADYAKRKKEWIENNPEAYQEYLESIKQSE